MSVCFVLTAIGELAKINLQTARRSRSGKGVTERPCLLARSQVTRLVSVTEVDWEGDVGRSYRMQWTRFLNISYALGPSDER